MADITNGCPTDSVNFKEAVCIDAGRVYDSCCEQHITLCTYTHKQKPGSPQINAESRCFIVIPYIPAGLPPR